MNDERLTRLLRETPLDGEAEARDRSWRVVQAAYAERIAAPRPAVTARRLVVALAAIGLLLALVLTPAGAKVVSAVKDAAGIGEKHAKPTLTSLPAPGSLAVESPIGPWVVHEDGSKRLLGKYRQATWSPHGLYLAVAHDHELTAVTPDGDPRWSIDGKAAIRDPRWSPSGIRVVYRSGSDLWLAGGDASFHQAIAHSIAPVAPAWRPIANPQPGPIQTGRGVNVVAYVDGQDRVVVRNTDTATTLWTSAPEPRPFALAWSADGRKLVAATRHALYTYRGGGVRTVSRVRGHQTIHSAAFLPGTQHVVLSLRAGSRGANRIAFSSRSSAIVSGRPDVEAFPHHRLFAAPGRLGSAVPSPDGSSVLVSWPQADQWIFIQRGPRRVKAVDNVSHQFDPRATGPVAFPRVEGWCCEVGPSAP